MITLERMTIRSDIIFGCSAMSALHAQAVSRSAR